jgi:hypothetical protein
MNPSIFTEAPQRAIVTTIQAWMQTHPTIAWILTHPLISLGLAFVVIVLLRGLLGAIARLTEHVWLVVLRAPMQLASWLFGVVLQVFYKPTPPPQAETPTQQQRLAILLDRLDALKQEQDELLREVRTVIGVEEP